MICSHHNYQLKHIYSLRVSKYNKYSMFCIFDAHRVNSLYILKGSFFKCSYACNSGESEICLLILDTDSVLGQLDLTVFITVFNKIRTQVQVYFNIERQILHLTRPRTHLWPDAGCILRQRPTNIVWKINSIFH